jgi:FkbM family methyltransferase
MLTELARQLQSLLCEDRASVCEREHTAFDALTAPFSNSLVLFGAGNLGRKTLAGLRRLGLEPMAFADNNPSSWNTTVDELQVLAPQDAARRYAASAAFVVTIWRGECNDRMSEIVEQLRSLGCARVVTFVPLYWKYPEIFLPHYTIDSPHKVIEQADTIREVFALWKDDASRREYLAQLRFRLLADFDGLPSPVAHRIYFPDDLVIFSPDEVFVDCGAYDGDTIRELVGSRASSFGQIIAFEPDPQNFAQLEHYVAGLAAEISRKITAHPFAVGARRGRLSFAATGSASSSVGAGTLMVESIAIDEFLTNQFPTYIKMDVEGAELDALAGARHLIERYTPFLAIAAYHRQDHLWRVAQYINGVSAGYRFFLRPHLNYGWDLVCYAVPAGRLL